MNCRKAKRHEESFMKPLSLSTLGLGAALLAGLPPQVSAGTYTGLWAGTVTIHANAKTGAHHHGHLESVIYVVRGRARMRWGERLEFTAEAGPGDFIYVPPYVPHQEINASDTEPLSCVLCRSGQQPVVVNLDIPAVEQPEEIRWVDDIHRSEKK